MNGHSVKIFESLGIAGNPFSEEAEIAYFFPTREHTECIQRIEMALQMNSGLSLILGEVGVGKTMMTKVVEHHFGKRKGSVTIRTIPRPSHTTEYRLLQALWKTFDIAVPCSTVHEYRDAIHDFLFRRVVEEGKNILLVVDDGEELQPAGLKVLRGILEYQFHGARFLHIVVFSRMELMERIRRAGSFDEFIVLKYTINPLSPDELKEVIFHRLKVAGNKDSRKLFDDPALFEIWRLSKGNLSTAGTLCSRSLLSMAMRNSEIVGVETVRSVARNWRMT